MQLDRLDFMTLEESFAIARKKLSEHFSKEHEAEGKFFKKFWVEGIGSEDVSENLSPVAAVDGGSRPVKYTQGQVIFLSSAAMVVKGKRLKRYRVYQFGITDYFGAEERIKYCREVLESKIARQFVLDGRGIVLLDGSLSAPLEHRVFVSKYELGSSYSLSYLLKDLISESRGVKGVRSYTHDLFLRDKLQAEVIDRLQKLVNENIIRKIEDVSLAMAFLERYEALKSYLDLYKESLNKKVVLVGISKRSSSRRYFNSKTPDIELVSSLARSEGYLIPRIYEFKPPDFMEANPIKITLTYVKLEKNTPPLKVEVLGEVSESELLEILKLLKGYSVKGYPYHLRLAHELAKITKEMVELILRGLEDLSATGREWLGE